MKTQNKYDVIVVGAGHAGCEAANIAATLGSKVLLVTMNMETIAKMSCNPAIGGVAKGQIVREIDSLGGLTGIVADHSTMQFRMLNTSKGPAMWSPRTQNDRTLFSLKWRQLLEENHNIDFVQDSVNQMIIENNQVVGVLSTMGNKYYAQSVVLTSGTFMNGIIHIGRDQTKGGRMGDRASYGITEQLVSLGFENGRMKTGTPPRVDGRSINYDILEEQKGDTNPTCFSFRQPNVVQDQHSCHITYTNPEVHDILRENLDESPLYNGTIKSIGPRYCPSIEDKINRFSERDRHQIFVEPEGWNTVETYINGFSSSLPQDVQYEALRKIKGFEQAKIFRPGYAIEYDFFFPTQLKLSLETKGIENLYFAGQINGTTGYEEAACQGLIAGINAHQKNNNNEPLILKRDEAYIGVLIDDLVNKGTTEPYRMFTSRAEYRILLRQDNADMRLMPFAHQLGTISDETYDALLAKKNNVEVLTKKISKVTVTPKETNPVLIKYNTAEIPQNYLLDKILSRPQIKSKHLLEIPSVKEWISEFSLEEIEQAEIGVKYKGYIKKEKENVEKLSRLEHIKIPEDFNFNELISLSTESRDKLTQIKPTSIGQASRISGVSPADISVLLVHFGR
ncbi:MAG: tRNA uridine-5-carboxymethylaminomethyl(34) synthesis enzyme MnmG [Bacteroidia bacterium]|nr:tRNA uridine-5-carboxymethylaminomethyl(34) synthesis enzyme MnmG [Bacteroidia bacterium]